jgi:uncharacterized repeat protein (TIGR03803 family)
MGRGNAPGTRMRVVRRQRTSGGVLPQLPQHVSAVKQITGIAGENAVGTVFRITLSGVLTTLHSFDNSDADPGAGLIQATRWELLRHDVLRRCQWVWYSVQNYSDGNGDHPARLR